jgi:hypothetical protein
MEDNVANLKKEIDRIFLQGLKKFPNCVSLRLNYGFFLMERMKNNYKAIE